MHRLLEAGVQFSGIPTASDIAAAKVAFEARKASVGEVASGEDETYRDESDPPQKKPRTAKTSLASATSSAGDILPASSLSVKPYYEDEEAEF